jgi:hypothetical protein
MMFCALYMGMVKCLGFRKFRLINRTNNHSQPTVIKSFFKIKKIFGLGVSHGAFLRYKLCRKLINWAMPKKREKPP